MKHILLTLALSLTMGMPAMANIELAKKNACMGCHAIDSKVLGPAFKDVAKRYASDKEALAKVSVSIKNGGKDKWGTLAMPPSEQLSDADVRTLSAWVLGFK